MVDERAVHSSVFFSEGIFLCSSAYPSLQYSLKINLTALQSSFHSLDNWWRNMVSEVNDIHTDVVIQYPKGSRATSAHFPIF